MYKIEYDIVNIGSKYYKEAVEMRYRVFFAPSHISRSVGIYDDFENDSIHIVATGEKRVVGYIRLTIDGNKGLVSQFVVDEKLRGTALIGKNLIDFVEKIAREKKVEYLYGEVRLHVAKAAKYYGFQVSDEVVYSKKTGLAHKKIEKKLSY